MPTYEYACTSCGERLEVVQRFSDDPLTVCPACEGALRKVFSPVGVVFKGSGFYKTDSRRSGSSTTSSDGKDKSADTKKSEPAPAADAKPAAAKTDGSGSGSTTTSTSSTGSGSGDRVA